MKAALLVTIALALSTVACQKVPIMRGEIEGLEKLMAQVPNAPVPNQMFEVTASETDLRQPIGMPRRASHDLFPPEWLDIPLFLDRRIRKGTST